MRTKSSKLGPTDPLNTPLELLWMQLLKSDLFLTLLSHLIVQCILSMTLVLPPNYKWHRICSETLGCCAVTFWDMWFLGRSHYSFIDQFHYYLNKSWTTVTYFWFIASFYSFLGFFVFADSSGLWSRLCWGCVSIILSFKLVSVWLDSSEFSTFVTLFGCFSLLPSEFSFRGTPSACLPTSSVLCSLAHAFTKKRSSSDTGPPSEKRRSRYAWVYWSEVMRSRFTWGVIWSGPVQWRLQSETTLWC